MPEPYTVRKTLDVVQYPIEEVFAEALFTKHIPEKFGPAKIACSHELLEQGSSIVSSVGFFMVKKFNFPVEVTRLAENELVHFEGETDDAKVDLIIAFRSLKQQAATQVNVSLELNAISRKAQMLEAMVGKEQTDCISRGIMTNIFDSVVASLDGRSEQIAS